MGISQRVKKGKWSAKEDAILLAFAEEKGPRPLWSELNCHPDPGQRLNRDSKSCRLRYENHLKPGLKHGPLTTEEQAVVVKMQLEVGNKWALIAAQLEGRTDNALKNWWNARFKPRKKNRHPDKDSRQIARDGKPSKHLQRMTNGCQLRPDGMSEEEFSSGSSSGHDGQKVKRRMEPLASSKEVLMTKREFHHAAFGRGDRTDRITVGNLRAGLRKVPSISNHLSKGTGSELTEDRDSSECSRSDSPRTSKSEEPPASMQGLVLEGVPTKAAPAETLLNNPPGSMDIVWGPFDAGLNGNWGSGCDVGLGWKIATLQQSAISDEAQSPLDEGMAPHCSLLSPFPFSHALPPRFLPEEMHSFLYQQAHDPLLFPLVDRGGTIDVYSDLEDLKPLSASEVLQSFPEWRDTSSRPDDADIMAESAADLVPAKFGQPIEVPFTS